MNQLDIHEEIQEAPKEELDEDDMQDILTECYVIIGQVLERKNPKRLQGDIASLYARLERAVAWLTLH